MRLFVAIPLPESQRADLAELAAGVPNARWVAPDALHLTLRFIGEVDGALARDADAALTQISSPSFALTLVGVGHFGAGEKSRALWVGVAESPELMRLQAKIERALQSAGLPPEGRRFKPHVTLARFKGNPGAKLHAYLARHALFRAEPFPVRAFTLYSSFLGHTGALYRAEASYDLGPPVHAMSRR